MVQFNIKQEGLISDSYEIFFKQNYSVVPTDKELKRYLEEEIFNDTSLS